MTATCHVNNQNNPFICTPSGNVISFTYTIIIIVISETYMSVDIFLHLFRVNTLPLQLWLRWSNFCRAQNAGRLQTSGTVRIDPLSANQIATFAVSPPNSTTDIIWPFIQVDSKYWVASSHEKFQLPVTSKPRGFFKVPPQLLVWQTVANKANVGDNVHKCKTRNSKYDEDLYKALTHY